jgi:hypothetical protein
VRVCVHRGECMRVYMSACVCTVFLKKKKIIENGKYVYVKADSLCLCTTLLTGGTTLLCSRSNSPRPQPSPEKEQDAWLASAAEEAGGQCGGGSKGRKAPGPPGPGPSQPPLLHVSSLLFPPTPVPPSRASSRSREIEL